MLTSRTKVVLALGGLAIGTMLGLAIADRASVGAPRVEQNDAEESALLPSSHAPLPPTSTDPRPAAKGSPTPTPTRPPPAEYFPRDPAEWQGMRVESANPLHCGEVDSCGMALACVDGRCVACTDDGQCAPGEACSMDRCLPKANVGCRSRRDCDAEELCLLTGMGGPTPRHNTNMTSYCNGLEGENPYADKGDEFPDHYAMPTPLPPERLGVGHMNLDRVESRARALLGNR